MNLAETDPRGRPGLLESRFTRPRGDCPHPERWTSTDGDSTEIEVSEMVAGMVRGLQPSVMVETGAAWGQTTEAVGRVLQENGHGHLWSLDPDEERFTAARDRVEGLPVTVLQRSSLDWTPPGVVDVLFSDSLYELRSPEIARFARWCRPGTVCLVHDTAPGHGRHRIPSTRDLRSELNARNVRWSWTHLPTPRGLSVGVFSP